MPKYDEISVTKLWPILKREPWFTFYMPNNIPKDRLPNHDYFFNVLNTLKPDYVKGLL